MKTDSFNNYDDELSPLNNVTFNLDNVDNDEVFSSFSNIN